tara:strand:+ start:8321 stop:9034 length:714 start_codon:yes stop_codon:yes gene_type:complete
MPNPKSTRLPKKSKKNNPSKPKPSKHKTFTKINATTRRREPINSPVRKRLRSKLNKRARNKQARNKQFVNQLEASEAARNKRTRNKQFVNQLVASEAARNKRIAQKKKNKQFVNQLVISEAARNKRTKLASTRKLRNIEEKKRINNYKLALKLYFRKYGRYPKKGDKTIVQMSNNIRTSGMTKKQLENKYLPLKKGWESKISKTQRPGNSYYYKTNTTQTQWNHPGYNDFTENLVNI